MLIEKKYLLVRTFEIGKEKTESMRAALLITVDVKRQWKCNLGRNVKFWTNTLSSRFSSTQ